MKIISLIAFSCLVCSMLVKGQTIVRFVPEKSLQSGTSQPFGPGKIEQAGPDFSQIVRIELPQKTLKLTLKPSLIKQYERIITSEGEVPSQVDFFESVNNNQKCYLATINKRFYSLLLVEDGNFFSIEKSNDSLYVYEQLQPSGSLSYSCTHDEVFKSKVLSTARMPAGIQSGCYEFPVGFVCDYAHYLYSGQNSSEIEADNLLKLAAAQELWTPYAFNAEIIFKTIGQVIYTNTDVSPWSTNSDLPLNTIWGELNHFWVKPNEWKKYKSLILAGITGINFADKLNWGYGGGGQNEFGMGTLVFRNYLDKPKLKWLFAHELGHVFGANHDATGNYNIMNPDYYYSGSTWSSKSKSSINETLNSLESKKMLNACSQLILRFEVLKDSLAFSWQTNYDSIEDSFLVEYSSDGQKTWTQLTEIKSKGTFSYQNAVAYKLSLGQETYFRIRQYGRNIITSNIVNVIIMGLDNKSTNDIITIYPNPFSDQLTIKTMSPQPVIIYDLSGRQMEKKWMPQTQHLINTSSWMPGMYFIQLGENTSNVYKIVK